MGSLDKYKHIAKNNMNVQENNQEGADLCAVTAIGAGKLAAGGTLIAGLGIKVGTNVCMNKCVDNNMKSNGGDRKKAFAHCKTVCPQSPGGIGPAVG
eukprot:NODE_8649_length_400_cov_987.951567_g7768_i0.p2 GENE.NODE_8649_length_400_cov_987.951567_g7768_i0~~NODE_8649_length_400_cov_987.951567_g7768_i0.p2  ORF type:complete len:106 (+),score=35.74 NODE_8649_length_400_cov_987.951567_g7768_i0:30-320(+)